MTVRYWLTVQVPVDVDVDQNKGIPAAQQVQDLGWDKLIDPDGPPEGMVERVNIGEARPEVQGQDLLQQAA